MQTRGPLSDRPPPRYLNPMRPFFVTTLFILLVLGAVCQLCGFSLSGEILTTRLSRTVTSMPHEARQYLQKVCTGPPSAEPMEKVYQCPRHRRECASICRSRRNMCI